MEKNLILTVCNGNIHRSVIASICINAGLQKMGLSQAAACVSRGLQGTGGTPPPRGKNLRDYPEEWPLTGPILTDLGIDLPEEQQSRPVNEQIVATSKLILAMDKGVLISRKNSLVKQFPAFGYKMRLFRELEGNPMDVPDCFGSCDLELHRRVNRLIHSIARGRMDTLLAWLQLFNMEEV